MSEHIYRSSVRLCLNDGLITQDISMNTGMKILLKGYLRTHLQDRSSNDHMVAYLQHST